MSEEFCVGVKLLLTRMKSHPEEFTKGYSRWESVISDIRNGRLIQILTDAEVTALTLGLQEALRPAFDAMVMEKLLVNEESQMELFDLECLATTRTSSATRITEELHQKLRASIEQSKAMTTRPE